MYIRSLGYRTDLFFPRFDAEVIDRGSYTVIRTPPNPTFYWGNFLLFAGPPGPGDIDRWPLFFAQEIGARPAVRHVAFGWDGIDGETGFLQPFLDAGFRLNRSVVLTTRKVQRPAKYSADITVRPLTQDWEWEGALAVQIACREPEHAREGYTVFKTRQMARYRAMTRAGLGQWFGAFLGEQVVGDLGLFVEQGVGRFQAVGTHPDFRRRGVCGRLVYEAARYGLGQLGAETLVMVADEDYHAARIYESVGFQPTERQTGIDWWAKDT